MVDYHITIEDNIITEIDFSDEPVEDFEMPEHRRLFIPKDVIDIEVEGLIGFNPAAIEVENGSETFERIANCLIRKADGALMMVCDNSIIPTDGSIRAIGAFAYNRYHDITKVNPAILCIPDGTEYIGYRAYAVYSAKDVNITVPASVELVDRMAFMIHTGGNVTITFEGDPQLVPGVFGTKLESIFSEDEVYRMMPDVIFADHNRLTVRGIAGSRVQEYCEKYAIKFCEMV